MRQRLLWYVLITINFKNLKKERKGGKNGEEGKGGGRKERKEVNIIPRADDFEREGDLVPHGVPVSTDQPWTSAPAGPHRWALQTSLSYGEVCVSRG